MIMNLLKSIYFTILFINFCNIVVNVRLSDEKCYKYYNEFGIHVNNLKIEDCEEVDVLNSPQVSAPDGFALKIKYKNGSELFEAALYLKKDFTLINDSTTVIITWTEVYHNRSENIGNLTTIKKFAADFENYYLYQNTKLNAAMLVVFYGTKSIVEGLVGNYALRYLKDEMKYIWMKVSYPYERIPFNWQSLGAPNTEINLSYNLDSHLEAVNVSLLVVLDDTTVEGKSPIDLIRNIVIHFNAVDMLFGNFTAPKIHFIIKMLAIPNTIYSKSYYQHKPINLATDDSTKNQPGIFLDMNVMPFCKDKTTDNCITHSETINFGLYCRGNDHSLSHMPFFKVRHMDFHGGYEKTAQLLALTFNASLLEYENKCTGIMSSYLDPPELPLYWSSCTIKQFSDYFKSVDAHCFHEINYLE